MCYCDENNSDLPEQIAAFVVVHPGRNSALKDYKDVEELYQRLQLMRPLRDMLVLLIFPYSLF
jgi:hypothetical protein